MNNDGEMGVFIEVVSYRIIGILYEKYHRISGIHDGTFGKIEAVYMEYFRENRGIYQGK